MREQRLVFGEDPELYDRARPGYPDAVVDDVLGFCGLEPARCRALEIGAGTGKATVAFARQGVRVRALEPDPAMAAVAERNCRPYPDVSIEVTSFEDWGLLEHAFDLVFSAQAWHWVRTGVRCTRAAAALAEGGCLALLWHRVRWAPDDPVRAALDECYREHAPALYARGPGFPGLTPAQLEDESVVELEACGHFVDVTVHEHPWSQSFGPARYVDRLRTQSDHRLLPDGDRRKLLEAIAEVIEAHGGSVTVPHSTLVVLARGSGDRGREAG